MKKTAKLMSVLLCIALILSSVFVTASAAITAAETPIDPQKTELKWSLKLGTGYNDAPSVPVIDGNCVFIMSRTSLLKISAESGETVKTAEMCGVPSFGYTPVLVAEGMIFCPLEGGKIHAFDVDTMKSLWTYTDPLGGQALSPIVLDNGLIFTGFWNDEELNANFICLDAESGDMKWSFMHKGGFYWAEPALIGDYLVLGSDNGSGSSETVSTLYCINKVTGEIIDSAEIIGDQRSGITQYNNSLYFVTKAGYLYKSKLDADGKFTLVEKTKLSGASTCTPTIYNEKIYIGVQSSGFSGNICIMDAETLEVLDAVPMNGYPQSEILLTTAYDDVYIYSTYNAAPGGITVVNGSSFTAQQLFTPEKGCTGYCISPVYATDNGMLIYKNDSGSVFAVGKAEPEKPQKSFFEKIIDWFMEIINSILSLFRGV